jgi:hypothetical protein
LQDLSSTEQDFLRRSQFGEAADAREKGNDLEADGRVVFNFKRLKAIKRSEGTYTRRRRACARNSKSSGRTAREPSTKNSSKM